MKINFIVCVSVVIFYFFDICISERVHIKIIIPYIKNKHTHKHIIYLHKPKLKPKYYGSYGVHNIHQWKINPNKVLKGTKPLGCNCIYPKKEVVKSIFAKKPTVAPKENYEVYENEKFEPYDENFEKSLKHHKYKDINNYKKYHKKEEYDFKKGEKVEKEKSNNYDFKDVNEKHGKEGFDNFNFYDKNTKHFSPEEGQKSFESYPNNVNQVKDIDQEEYEYITDKPKENNVEFINDNNDEDILVNYEDPNTQKSLKIVEPNPNDYENVEVLKPYEVTEKYSEEEDDSIIYFGPDDAIDPSDIYGKPKQYNEDPNNSEKINEPDLHEPKQESLQEFTQESKPREIEPKHHNDWSKEYDISRKESIEKLDKELEEDKHKTNEDIKRNLATKVRKVDADDLNDGGFMNWAVDNGAFGLGYNKKKGKSEKSEIVRPGSTEFNSEHVSEIK